MLISKKSVCSTLMLKKCLPVLAVAAITVVFPQECVKGALEGIKMCLYVLVPSMFPYIFVACYISESGVGSYLCNNRAVRFICVKLFGVSQECFPILMMSIIGGYVAGAKSTEVLLRNGRISQADGKKMSYVAVGAGPGFLVNYVGIALCDNSTVGTIMLIGQVFSISITAVLQRKSTFKADNDSSIQAKQINKNSSSCFVTAVNDTAVCLLSLCAIVVLFSCYIQAANALFGNSVAWSLIIPLIEVTNGCRITVSSFPLWFSAFVTGFGGLCVHFQIFSILKNVSVNKVRFYFIRLIQGVICGTFFYIASLVLNVDTTVFNTTTNVIFDFFSTYLGGVMLILSSLCFLFSVRNIIRR